MSEWTNTKGDKSHCETLRGKEIWLCFPNWHDSHHNLDKLDKLGTSCYNLARLGWPKWAWIRDGDFITTPTYVEGRRC